MGFGNWGFKERDRLYNILSWFKSSFNLGISQSSFLSSTAILPVALSKFICLTAYEEFALASNDLILLG